MPGPGGSNGPQRTFGSKLPWAKDGPPPIPMPTAPWALNQRRESRTSTDDAPAFMKVRLKSVPKPADLAPEASTPSTPPTPEPKVSKITINMSQSKKSPSPQSTASSQSSTLQSAQSPSKSPSQSPSPSSLRSRENGSSSRSSSNSRGRLERSRSRGEPSPLSRSDSSSVAAQSEAPTLKRSESRANMIAPPPLPPRPPPPPPARIVLKDLPPLTETQKKNLEALKSRPKKRPDWSCMMKEVETGIKLKHVQCNDRSAPIIDRALAKVSEPTGDAHFVFASEKSNVHNKLLQEIQSGVKLKSVKTNDRSKPILQGLQKGLRRQLTIEDQMQKVDSKVSEAEPIADDMDDIDKVRDELQSHKQLLESEMRNKAALERENKRLQARILNLEVELERERTAEKSTGNQVSEHDEKLKDALKKEAELARKEVERIEQDFAVVAEARDKALSELEEMKRAYASLEKRMKAGMALAGCPSAKDVARIATQKSIERAAEPESEEEEEETESEEESEEDEDPKVVEDKRNQREIEKMKNKIKNFRDKIDHSNKERQLLRKQIKEQEKMLDEEKKKYKNLHKEVDKMARLMDPDYEGDSDEEEEEEEEEEEKTESEESESEESEDEDESDTDDESLPLDERKALLQHNINKFEGRYTVVKKGNFKLQTHFDNLRDDLVKQRAEVATLKQDLDSVLAELG
ncbi:microfibrillar-associated protein 1-like [Trichogramma pretiosum]|uniref:microfibrillar-associated protein 1-like n=1 Tax=Trichogramma pretiosum TaxID=7493 RepID=UPI0006C9D159|nr:microfibrillar-associated protein 1-like [Trichogramma pretiosum]